MDASHVLGSFPCVGGPGDKTIPPWPDETPGYFLPSQPNLQPKDFLVVSHPFSLVAFPNPLYGVSFFSFFPFLNLTAPLKETQGGALLLLPLAFESPS